MDSHRQVSRAKPYSRRACPSPFDAGSQCQAALAEHSISEIHYLSIDTEGNEGGGSAHRSNFDAVMIHVITVEANYNEPRDEIDAMLFRRF